MINRKNVYTRSSLLQEQTTKNKCDSVEAHKMWRPMGKCSLCPLDKSGPAHRTLKATLMARCTSPEWIAQQSWVLLGLQTSPKEGIYLSPAELMYGEPLVVPAEFFPFSQQDMSLGQLHQFVKPFNPVGGTGNGIFSPHIPNDLHTCRFIFLYVNFHHAPITWPTWSSNGHQKPTKLITEVSKNGLPLTAWKWLTWTMTQLHQILSPNQDTLWNHLPNSRPLPPNFRHEPFGGVRGGGGGIIVVTG